MIKKIITLSAIASTVLFSQALDIKKGWNNIGLSSQYSVQDLAQSYQGLKMFWYFDPVNKNWSFYSPNSLLMQAAKSAGYYKISQTLPLGSGIWVFSDSNFSIDVDSFIKDNIFESFYSTYYENVKYAIGRKRNIPYISISSNDENTSRLIPINLTKNNQTIQYSWNSGIMARDKDNLIFFFVTQDINNSDNRTAWVGSYKDGNITSLKDILSVNYGWIGSYDNVFTSPESNSTQYILFSKNDYENNNAEVAIAEKKGDDDWNILEIPNGSYFEDVNYNYIYRDNSSDLYVLNGFNIITQDYNKTLIYKVDSNIHKVFELDGYWQSFTSFYDNENNYYKIMFNNDNQYSYRGGKNLAIIINNESINYANMDHIVRTIGVLNLNDDQKELYAFAHDKIGDTLYVYKSSDYGKSWSLAAQTSQFEYQIDYIYEIFKDEADNIHCKLGVEDYGNYKYIETNDSFATWNNVKENYKISNNFNKNKKFIKRVEPDGSITLINRK